MAEAPAAPTESQQAQPAPMLTSIDGLDAAMASARQAATEQQAAIETGESGAQERPAATSTPTAEAATPVQPAESTAPEEGDEDQETPADQQIPGKPSRMGRLREQLTQADQRAREADAKLQERLAVEVKVRQKWAGLLGTPEERGQLEAVLANPASPATEVNQARSRLAQMKTAQSELAPLYAAIEEDVFAGFTRGLDALRTLDGMDDAAHQALFKATSGVEALKLIHGVGKKAAEDEYKGELASLKAQVSDLRTKLAAAGVQPAGAGGRTPGGANGLAGLLDERGLPTEDAIARAKAGGLRQLVSAST